ncbi:MAG: EamA family transporter [Clostridia bacterium]|nr:EamA family transporter [Clostridia bacterium]
MVIGYTFLAIALFCGVTKGYCGKKSGGTLAYTSDALIVNTLRMALCILIGFIMVAVQGKMSELLASPKILGIAALSGISTAAFVVSWLLSVRTGAYMMVDVCLMLGIIIPMVLCDIIYGENITLPQWLGIALLMVAGYIMCTYNSKLKGKMSFSAAVTLFICAASNGITDFSQKMFVKAASGVDIAVFNLYTYLFAALTLLICFPLFRARDKKTAASGGAAIQSPVAVVKPIAIYVAIMAVCLFLNSYFKTAAAGHLTATQIYPINQGGSLILSMLMAHFLFKEKINLRAVIGIALCLCALLIINLT